MRTSLWSGGLECAAAVALPEAAPPRLTAYDARSGEHAVRLREARAAGGAPAVAGA
ncbi:hypothetical protein [Streptomyces sp. ICBB 8177]|uniref:hypothetical protein n=1 Tax=Streptomyces sp. ICBB 8177 TaxID=563922 RepID=UPI00130524FB|nr:hypothetical protein [Streptomyces sp. ICBB 8177]